MKILFSKIESRFFAFILIAFFALSASPAFAAQVKIGTDIEMVSSGTSTISENLYIAAGQVKVSENLNHDLFIAGGENYIAGNIAGDVMVFGGKTFFEGNITGDLRIIGGEVYIKGQVSGDLFIVGGHVELADSAQISGQNIIIAGELSQNSELNNYSKILAGKIIFNDIVSGQVEATTQHAVFGKDASITGSVRYFAPNKADQLDGAQIFGQITFNEIKNIRETGVVKSMILNLISFWIIWRFITTLLIAFLLVYIFRVFSQRSVDIMTNSFVKSFFSGLLSIFALPIIVALLFLSLVALPVGIILFMMYVAVLIAAPAISGIFVGSLIHRLFSKPAEEKELVDLPSFTASHETTINFRTAALGVVLLTLLQFVPIAGDLTRLIFTLAAVGAIMRYIWGSMFRRKK